MCYVVYAVQVFLIFFVVHILALCSHNLDRIMTEEHFAGWTAHWGKEDKEILLITNNK